MSKKTRKKSSTKPSKTSAGKPAAARTARAGAKTKVKKAQVGKQVAKPVAKKPAAKAGKAVAGKSPKAAKPAAAKESHKAASKPLKSNLSSASKPAAAPKAAVAPKPPAASKPVSAPKPASAPKAATTAVEGGKAPGFRLPRDGGDTVSLADYAGRKLVLFFYPRADTPGCTREAQDFTRLKGEFAQVGADVIGISADTVKAQEASGTSTSWRYLWYRMSSMRCWRPMAPGVKSRCMAEASWESFGQRF